MINKIGTDNGMKFTKEIKKKIDKYFDNISGEDLYKLLTEKYHLKDNNN